MGKPRAIRDRKSEMLGCWACFAFVAILLIAKTLLIGASGMGFFNIIMMVLLVVWLFIALFYTYQYYKWKKINQM